MPIPVKTTTHLALERANLRHQAVDLPLVVADAAVESLLLVSRQVLQAQISRDRFGVRQRGDLQLMCWSLRRAAEQSQRFKFFCVTSSCAGTIGSEMNLDCSLLCSINGNKK